MIDNGCSNGEPAVDDRGRGNGDAGLLNVCDDLGIHLVTVVAAVSKADDIQLHGGGKLEFRGLIDSALEILRESAGARDDGAQLRGAIDLEREPRLERAEASRQIGTEVTRPWRSSREPALLSPKVRGRRGEGLGVLFAIAH